MMKSLLSPPSCVLEALLGFANRKKVSAVRDRGNGDKQVIPVNITDVEKGRQPDIILEPKDIVIVPEKFFSF